MSLDGFARDVRDSARTLRAVPGALERAVRADAPQVVAAPVADAVAAAWTGPHARVLSAGTSVRVIAGHPAVVVGGSSPRLSGGAGPSDLVWGNEVGGGRRPRTRQFRGLGRRTVERAVDRAAPRALERLTDLVSDTIDRLTRG